MHRPEPLLFHDAQPIDQTTPPLQAAGYLLDGEYLVVKDLYGTGQKILSQLRVLMPPPADDSSYADRQEYRSAWQEASRRLLMRIVQHRLAVLDPPTIGFLPLLYPDHHSFSLPFVDVADLNSAWNLFNKGVHLPVLGYRLHPFYGTYVPSRMSHLELFGTWLSQHKGSRRRAIDVGTGCGVIALMLCKAGFKRVLATDSNPNAIESVKRDLRRLSPPPPIDPHLGDLLGTASTPADLVVFNPPWTRGTVNSPLDRALYFDDDLFERFFDQASEGLTRNGRVVLLFSNLTTLVQPDSPHPIEAELKRGRFTLVQKLNRKVKAAKIRGHMRSTRERVEVWELARA